MRPKLPTIIFTLALLIFTAAIWYNIYNAGFLPYDDNFGALILAFLLSICAFFALLLTWFYQRNIVAACKWQAILFLIVSSPVTVIIVVLNYKHIFGVSLQIQ